MGGGRRDCAPRTDPVYGGEAGGRGTLSFRDLAWQSHGQQTEVAADVAPSRNERDLPADVPSPLYYGGRFSILNGVKRKLHCVNPADGAVIWRRDLDGRLAFPAPAPAAARRAYVRPAGSPLLLCRPGGVAWWPPDQP